MSLLVFIVAATTIALPGGAPVGMDYLAYDAANHRLWVPAGNTGNVDVVDTVTGVVTPIGGFATAPSSRPGRPNMGPSSATIGDGVAWIGNRADKRVCSFDARSLAKRACVQLAAMPDGIQYVATTRELWVTTPATQEILVVDVKSSTPVVIASVKLTGSPEGYALDEKRGVFYTNLEDKDTTLAIDLKTRKLITSWPSTCGGDGPRGLAIDPTRRLLFVACADGVVSQDLAHGGKPLGHVRTGPGVDSIDYAPLRSLLYVASRQDGTLHFIGISDAGALRESGTTVTSPGARNAIIDAEGTAYVEDSAKGQLIVVKPPAH